MSDIPSAPHRSPEEDSAGPSQVEPQPPAEPQPPVPRWEHHRRIEADRIVAVSEGSELALFRWHLECGATVDVHQWLAARVAQGSSPIGGYYVKYDDGFETWELKDEFEAIYRRVATEA